MSEKNPDREYVDISKQVKAIYLVTGISKEKKKPWTGVQVEWLNGSTNLFFPYPSQIKAIQKAVEGSEQNEISKKIEESVDPKKSFLD